MKITYILGVILLVIAGIGGGFFAGVSYAQTQAQNATANFVRQRAVPTTDSTQGTQGTQGQGQGFFVGGGFAGNIPCGTNAGGTTTQNPNRQGGNQNQTPSPNQTPRAGNNQRQDQLAQLGNCVAQGTVKSIDGDTVTISTPDSVVTVKLSTQTVVTVNIRGNGSEIKTGDRVTVFSQETGNNPTASVVQVQRNDQ